MIICIDGGLGSGKTYTAVELARHEYLAGRRIFANFGLPFAQRVASWYEAVAIRDGVFIMDEAHLNLDSREFAKNVSVTPWLTQLRKLGVDLMYISQDFGQVDKRLRDLTDILVRCYALANNSARATRRITIRLHPLPGTLLSDSIALHDQSIYTLFNTRELILPLYGKIPSIEELVRFQPT